MSSRSFPVRVPQSRTLTRRDRLIWRRWSGRSATSTHSGASPVRRYGCWSAGDLPGFGLYAPAYASDLLAWDRWCIHRGLDALAARRVHVDLYLSGMLESGLAPATADRRLSALSSFYRFLQESDAGVWNSRANPVSSVRRPAFDRHHSGTLGLTRDQARALLGAIDRARGPQHLRNAALMPLLLYNALRVDELLSARITGLDRWPGRETIHDTLEVRRKGGHRVRVALATGTSRVLERYLATRATAEGAVVTRSPARFLPPVTVDRSQRRQCGSWCVAPLERRRSSIGPVYLRTRCATTPSPLPSMRERRCGIYRTSLGTGIGGRPVATTAAVRTSTGPPPMPCLLGSATTHEHKRTCGSTLDR